MLKRIQTDADKKVEQCLTEQRSFSMVAGAGSGKTTSLITALEFLRTKYALDLRRNAQRIACITYTKRAVEVISSRLGHDDMYLVSTLHSFLWNEIKGFSHDIREAVRVYRIPQLLEKARKNDNGGNSQRALSARAQIVRLEVELTGLDEVSSFKYDDTVFSDYSGGRLSHDDIIEIAGYLLAERPVFRKAVGFRYPFIFVDEAQDTFENIVTGLNLTCEAEGLPIVGYFGDPWQQIYDKRAGDFSPPPSGIKITKTENFRSSESVVAFLNAFREDVEQVSAGKNKGREGSVLLTLVQAEDPEGQRRRYSEPQVERALQRLDVALENWDWADQNNIIKLFLVRQMIARRLGFADLHKLFTGQYSSFRAQDNYETGDHFLLKPFINTIWPIVVAFQSGSDKAVIELLRRDSPAFDVNGSNSGRTLRDMVNLSNTLVSNLAALWKTGTMRDVLIFCRDNSLIHASDRLAEHLERRSRTEAYDKDVYGEKKSDWLCDHFFTLGTTELEAYCDFMQENTAYSTQHGVKGEQYSNVLVVLDDIEAAWNNYSFTKLLIPSTAGEPTEGQLERSRKLAYVCFSRAEENLRVLLFTLNPQAAKQELLDRGLLSEKQIDILD